MGTLYSAYDEWGPARSITTRQPLYFITDRHLLCARHARGASLQPFTKLDQEAGFGSGGCAFCPGGALAGHFSEYRSRKAVLAAVEALDEKDEKPR